MPLLFRVFLDPSPHAMFEAEQWRVRILLVDQKLSAWIDGKTVCAENSVGQCNPMRGQPKVSDAEPSG